jgi:hypothetical protein
VINESGKYFTKATNTSLPSFPSVANIVYRVGKQGIIYINYKAR